MNNFQSIDSGQGILKNDYGDTPLALAIKKRLKKKMQKFDDVENNETTEDENNE